jgi:hypothetical protein
MCLRAVYVLRFPTGCAAFLQVLVPRMQVRAIKAKGTETGHCYRSVLFMQNRWACCIKKWIHHKCMRMQFLRRERD